MIKFAIPIERLLFLAIIGILMGSLFVKRCAPISNTSNPIVTTVSDTLWQVKRDTFKVNTVHYKTVYVNPEDVSDILLENTVDPLSHQYEEARSYRDTLSNDDIDIYSYNLVKGELLDNKLSYDLKIPRQVTVTKTIKHPPSYRSGFYLFGEAGGNPQTLDNLSMGLQYNRKGKWFVSYRYNLKRPSGQHP